MAGLKFLCLATWVCPLDRVAGFYVYLLVFHVCVCVLFTHIHIYFFVWRRLPLLALAGDSLWIYRRSVLDFSGLAQCPLGPELVIPRFVLLVRICLESGTLTFFL